MKAPRSTPISSDNDSIRWELYLPSMRAGWAPKTHRVFAFPLQRRFGIAS